MATLALRILSRDFPLPPVRKVTGRLTVVHSIYRTAAEERIIREVTNPKYTAYERDYLEWYHHDPLKRSTTQAHAHSYNHRTELLMGKRCGCFHCGALFNTQRITEWMEASKDWTASCPECDMDAVIGEASGYPLTTEFLSQMQQDWFPE